MGLTVETVVNGPFVENSFVIWDDSTKKAVIIDPGAEPDRIAGCARVLGVTVTEIVCTHAHIDHVGAVAKLKDTLKVPVALHKLEKEVLGALKEQAALFGLRGVDVPRVDRWLEEGDSVSVGESTGRVIHTPGHTPGGISIYFQADKLLFAGDTLFQGSIGRTDLPGGSFEAIISSIKEKLVPLGDDVRVYCGHGPMTTIHVERQYNPFLR